MGWGRVHGRASAASGGAARQGSGVGGVGGKVWADRRLARIADPSNVAATIHSSQLAAGSCRPTAVKAQAPGARTGWLAHAASAHIGAGLTCSLRKPAGEAGWDFSSKVYHTCRCVLLAGLLDRETDWLHPDNTWKPAMRRVLCLRKPWDGGLAPGTLCRRPALACRTSWFHTKIVHCYLGYRADATSFDQMLAGSPSSGSPATHSQRQTAAPGGRRRGALELIRTGLIGGWRAAWRVDQLITASSGPVIATVIAQRQVARCTPQLFR